MINLHFYSLEWLIIDECDRLFEPTFRDQISLIFNACNQSNAKLNHAMFSATYDPNLEKWCKLNLNNIATVIIGGRNKVTETVEQKLIFVGTESVSISSSLFVSLVLNLVSYSGKTNRATGSYFKWLPNTSYRFCQ